MFLCVTGIPASSGTATALHNGKGNPGSQKILCLFSASAEYKGIPAFQPHHLQAFFCFPHQEFIDLILPGAMSGPFAHINLLTAVFYFSQ